MYIILLDTLIDLPTRTSFTLQYSEVSEGYCVASDHDVALISGLPWYKKRGVWFLLYSFLFDGSLVTCASWRLIKCVRGPSGLQRISKLLFLNNVHFLCIVSLANLIEFIIFVFFSNSLPSLLPLTVVVEVILGMQLLISEQDAAHGYGKTWVSGGNGTRNTTFPTSMPRTSHATSSHWTESKRGGGGSGGGVGGPNAGGGGSHGNGTGSMLSSSQQQTSSTFTSATSTRGLSGGANGLEGIRYDCTEEVLVDYDYDMTLAPTPKDAHHHQHEQGHDLTDFGPYQGGQTLDGVRRTMYESNDLERTTTAYSTSSTTALTGAGKNPAGYTAGVSPSRPRANSSATAGGAAGGVSIRDIRARVTAGGVESEEDHPGGVPPRSPFESGTAGGVYGATDGYDTRPLHDFNGPTSAPGGTSSMRTHGAGGASTTSNAQPPLKKSGSISSFSTCNCSTSGGRDRESISYGAALSSPNETPAHQHLNINVTQQIDHSSIEEVIPVNSDAPFAEYQRPMTSGSGGGGGGGGYAQNNNPYSNNPYAGRGGY